VSEWDGRFPHRDPLPYQTVEKPLKTSARPSILSEYHRCNHRFGGFFDSLLRSRLVTDEPNAVTLGPVEPGVIEVSPVGPSNYDRAGAADRRPRRSAGAPTMQTAPLLIVSGSNRPNSNTLRVAKIIEGHYRRLGAPVELYGLEQLPPEVFTPEAYTRKPDAFVLVQQRVLEAPGLHVVTPEYNGSFPGILKHFIDLLKFPESFEGKPVAFVGIASGSWGGLRAVEQLQMVFGYRNAHVYPDRVFLPGISSKLAPDGTLTDPALDGRLAAQTAGFAKFAHALGAAR